MCIFYLDKIYIKVHVHPYQQLSLIGHGRIGPESSLPALLRRRRADERYDSPLDGSARPSRAQWCQKVSSRSSQF